MATTYEEHLAMMKLMMQDMIQINKDNMSQLVGAMNKSENHHEDKFDKLCKPNQFRGEESKYHEWMSSIWRTPAAKSQQAMAGARGQ